MVTESDEEKLTKEEQQAAYDAWLASRPECVRKLAAEFPINSRFMVEGILFHLLGYTEGDTLIVSPIDPLDFYDEAMAAKVYMCAEHFRGIKPQIYDDSQTDQVQ